MVDTACRFRPLLPRRASQVISREIINLGFANNGVMELSVAALLGDITEAAAIIIDCLPNMTPAQVTNRTVPLVKSPPVVPPWPRWPPVAGTRRGWQQLRQPWPRPRPWSPRLWGQALDNGLCEISCCAHAPHSQRWPPSYQDSTHTGHDLLRPMIRAGPRYLRAHGHAATPIVLAEGTPTPGDWLNATVTGDWVTGQRKNRALRAQFEARSPQAPRAVASPLA